MGVNRAAAALWRLLMLGWLVALLVAMVSPVAAADNASPTDVLNAIVRLTAEVPRDAATAAGLGTRREGNGIVVDNTGLVLTIGYLVIEAQSITLTLGNGKSVAAEFVGYDHDSGFGLVRTLTPLGIKPLRLGDSDDLKDDDRVLAVGAGGPAGATGATVVDRRTFTGGWEYLVDNAIFTTPAHRDWGGAALVNTKGELVGVGSLFLRNAATEAPVRPGNMFVPINLLKPIFADMLTNGRPASPPRPWIGVFTQELSELLVVTSMWASGPAAKAGLKPGDVIVGVGRTRIKSQEEFLRTLWQQGTAGSVVDVKVLRDGAVMDFKVRAGSRYEVLKLNRTF